MKIAPVFTAFASICLLSSTLSAQSNQGDTTKNLYIDVHHLGPGKVTYKAVAAAHKKDLAVESKYGVHFINYWVDEAGGTIYCLSTAPDSDAIRKTHAEAHGLLPDQIFPVVAGAESPIVKGGYFYLDFHEFGPGNVTAAAVVGAHQKDLATEGKYGVNFLDYWVDEKAGLVVCLSQAADSSAVINTHREAHGLLPESIVKVKPGNQ